VRLLFDKKFMGAIGTEKLRFS